MRKIPIIDLIFNNFIWDQSVGSCSVCICLFVLFHVLLLTMNYPVENENEIFVLHLVLFSCLTVKNFIYTAQVDNTVLLNLHFLAVSALCFVNNFTDTQYDIQIDFADLTYSEGPFNSMVSLRSFSLGLILLHTAICIADFVSHSKLVFPRPSSKQTMPTPTLMR